MYNGQFDKQLNYIVNKNYVLWTKELLDNVPEYFWTVAASSTGKYHPQYALGEAGLVRHTAASAEIGNCLLNETNIYDSWTQDDKDIAICSLLLHDTFKHGLKGGKYTVHEHPVIAADFVRSYSDRIMDDDELKKYFYESVALSIESHMGKWNTCKWSNVVLPTPKTDRQFLVHLCDYLASRKFIEINFKEI